MRDGSNGLRMKLTKKKTAWVSLFCLQSLKVVFLVLRAKGDEIAITLCTLYGDNHVFSFFFFFFFFFVVFCCCCFYFIFFFILCQ